MNLLLQITGGKTEAQPSHVLLENAHSVVTGLFLDASMKEHFTPSVISITTDMDPSSSDIFKAEEVLFAKALSKRLGAYCYTSSEGVSAELHLRDLSQPGVFIAGSDPFMPMLGAVGMLAITYSPLELAAGICGEKIALPSFTVIGLKLVGSFKEAISAIDLALEIIRRTGTHYEKPICFEFFGSGVSRLTVEQRASVARLLAASGVRAVLFPSDEETESYFQRIGRKITTPPLMPTDDTSYSKVIELDLTSLVPLICLSDDFEHIKPVGQANAYAISQVVLGGAIAGRLNDAERLLSFLGEQKVAIDSFTFVPATRGVLQDMADQGILAGLLRAGVNIERPSMLFAQGVLGIFNSENESRSLRTMERLSFSWSKNGEILLASPETLAVSALKGVLTDPREIEPAKLAIPSVPKALEVKAREERVARQPLPFTYRIKALPEFRPTLPTGSLPILARLADFVNDEQLLSRGVAYYQAGYSIHELSKLFCSSEKNGLWQRALEKEQSVLVAGKLFGLQVSNEKSALVARFLGIRLILAKSFAPKMSKHLIHAGIIPMTFDISDHYEICDESSEIQVTIDLEKKLIKVSLSQKNIEIPVTTDLSDRDWKIIEAGSLHAYLRAFRV